MSDSSTRRKFLAATGSAAALAIAGCSGGSGTSTPSPADGMTESGPMGEQMTDDEMTEGDAMASTTVTVRIENVAPSDVYGADSHTGGAVWITPGAYAVHSGGNPIYTDGEAASIGLEALAEAGPPTGFEGEAGLVDELGASMAVQRSGAYTPANTVADPNDPRGEVPGAPPIAPGGAFEFEIEVTPGQRLSVASMFVPSNDVFVSTDPSGIALWPEDGEPVDGDVTDSMSLFDAGTEPNAEAPGTGPDQAPAQDAPDQGAEEGGTVRRLSAVDDGHEYPAVEDVVQVTVTPN